jgi:F420-non-reducing hydrogenase iron-sulfur subunit
LFLVSKIRVDPEKSASLRVGLKGLLMHAEKQKHDFEPKIVAFVCTWCTYAGADLAGTSRMQYPSNVRVLKFPCTGRIDPVFILRAFQKGADGVLVSGCHPGDCHYMAGNFHARRRFAAFRKLIEFVGVDLARLQFSWVSAAEGGKWVEVVTELTERADERVQGTGVGGVLVGEARYD